MATVAVLLGLCGCGETSTGLSPGAVAECLREHGAVVHRQVDQIAEPAYTAAGHTGDFYETQSVTDKFGDNTIHLRIRLLADPSKAKYNELMLGKELVEVGPSGARATTEAVEGGEAVIGVKPVATMALGYAPITRRQGRSRLDPGARAFLHMSKTVPTKDAEALARKCAAVGVA